MSMILMEAAKFAAIAHGDQKRKYTGDPYISHCFDVAAIVSPFADNEMICAAILHDVVEDTDRTIGDIETNFGSSVASLVYWLTDASIPSDGNRAKRKAIDREHIAQAPVRAKTVKLADLISNSMSIKQYDPDFAKVYLAEKRLLLDVMKDAEPTLWRIAAEFCK